MIELLNIAKTFTRGPQRIALFDNLSAKFQGPGSHAIVGKSGSGKSTLLSLMAGLDVPDRGEVRLDQRDMGTLTEQQRSELRLKRIGIVFQQFHLMDRLTALENVRLPAELASGSTGHQDARAQELLARVGLSDRAEHFPSQLSGGECQRVAIARALMMKPSVILADEPTGNLDEHTGEQVIEDLFNLVAREQTLLIVVTHDNELARRCQHVWRLEHGQLCS